MVLAGFAASLLGGRDPALVGRAKAVVAKALGPTPYPINFGISMTGSVAPYMLTN